MWVDGYSGDGTSIEFWDLWGNNQSQKPWDWDFSHECLCHTRMFPADFFQVASGLHFSAFWRPDNQKVWMLMITSRKFWTNEYLPQEHKKEKYLDFISFM